jgi:hypothetical protein
MCALSAIADKNRISTLRSKSTHFNNSTTRAIREDTKASRGPLN